MKSVRLIAAFAMAVAGTPALCGPPYLTDDPVPTDTGHWEIYDFSSGEGRNSLLNADAGLDLNYGPVPGVQLTATLPLSFSHDTLGGSHSGTGDVELGVKYRFFHDEKHGISAAIFPRTILPTSSIADAEKIRLLLPIWIAKDFSGGTSLFGGGGYEFNPGPGNRSFWEAAVALTQDLNKTVSVGAELTWQQPDTAGATNQVRAGAGAIIKLSDHYALLFSGGPTWTEHRTGYHFYGSLGVFF